MRISYTFLLICILFNTLPLLGQGWERVYEGDINSQIFEILPTSTGNYILRGNDVDTATLTNESLTLMINDAGDVIWNKTFSSTNTIPSFVAEAVDGSFILEARKLVEINGEEYDKAQIIKIDVFGNIIWEYTFMDGAESSNSIKGVFVNDDNSVSFFDYSNPDFIYIHKIDEEGNLFYSEPTDLVVNNNLRAIKRDDNFLFWEIEQIDSINSLLTYQTDLNGSLSSTQTYNNAYAGKRGTAIPMENGDWVVVNNAYNSNRVNQIKIEALSGTVTIDTIWDDPDFYQGIVDVELLEDGLIMSLYQSPVGKTRMMKTDFDGNVLWTKLHAHRPGDIISFSIVQTQDSGFLLAGEIDNGFTRAYVFRTDENGNIYPNIISGKVSIDTSLNCIIDLDEEPLEDWIVTSEKAGTIFMSTTNNQGDYSLPADTGQYTLTLQRPNDYWEPCENELEVNFSNTDTSTIIDFPVEIAIECPSMVVSQTVPIIRPCFERPSYVNYCNLGTVQADSAYIEITYDSLITPISSSIPWDSLGDNIYRFNLGDLAPLECGAFTVDLFLDCEATVGAAYCIETHAHPDTLCSEPAASWTGAFLEVLAACEGDSVYFRLENTGDGNMDGFSKYIIVEDIVLLKSDSVELESGSFDTVPLPANGSTYTIIAEQVPEAPGFTVPTAIVEGCGENGDGEFSIGFSNQFPLNDANPFLDIDCPVAISSFDPNDKQGFPIGYGDEHFILPETSIEYLIRFQNTGTDTAFTVIIRDTLDPQLDIASFHPGASSHDFDFQVSGEGILTFNFQNIMLPDSNVNEAASNGFVEFKIAPKSDLELGSIIKNRAAIFFDFNDPVITNETFHTLEEEFIDVLVGTIEHPTNSNITIVVQPNPFVEQAVFDIKNHLVGSYSLEIFDIKGRLLRKERHEASPLTFYKKELEAGLYFYRLTAEDGFINTGKIVIH